ncbi:MAG: hypothetical protein LT070_07135 [Solirubrobacteraceae bacterium]|nr:hypothetical protein [Solirubrobacteraceae bacterium]
MPRLVQRSVVALIATGAALVVADGAQAAPSIGGRVTGSLPKRSLTEVRAFDAASGTIAAAAGVGRSGAFRLSLPPGGYLLTTTTVPRRGAVRRRVTPVTLAGGQRRGAVKIARPRAAAASRAPSAHAAYSQESRTITPGAIAFAIEEFRGATGELAVMNRGLSALLQTDLVSTPCRSVEVANSADRKLVERELTFQKSRYVDPSTRVTRNFVLADIVVQGRLRTAGTSLRYALTLVDARTRARLETVSGTLGENLFADEERLATRLAKRLCAYDEVYEVTFTGIGTATFATHEASGTLAAAPITATASRRDGRGAIEWKGNASIAWKDVVVSSHTDCGYVDPVSGGSWEVTLARKGSAMQVDWTADRGSTGTATVVCPTDGGAAAIPGQPTLALVGVDAPSFPLPPDARRAITGGLKSAGDGWDDTLQIAVRTVRVRRAAS